MGERLQKILARAGYGSRRSCEELISAGRVRVNGQAVGLGDKADAAKDKITVDGRAVKQAESLVYVALYKPRGVISTVSDPDLRPAVRDLVPVEGTLYPVGRLDFDSEGLVLMTNDGDLANKLTHPRYEHEKEYRVLVAKHPDPEQLNLWRRGVVLEDGFPDRSSRSLRGFQAGEGRLAGCYTEGRPQTPDPRNGYPDRTTGGKDRACTDRGITAGKSEAERMALSHYAGSGGAAKARRRSKTKDYLQKTKDRP